MTWIVLALFCAVVLVLVFACCRMAGMSDQEVEMYAEEQARLADYEYLLSRRSEITQKTN